jgi:hypothetical protein
MFRFRERACAAGSHALSSVSAEALSSAPAAVQHCSGDLLHASGLFNLRAGQRRIHLLTGYRLV